MSVCIHCHAFTLSTVSSKKLAWTARWMDGYGIRPAAVKWPRPSKRKVPIIRLGIKISSFVIVHIQKQLKGSERAEQKLGLLLPEFMARVHNTNIPVGRGPCWTSTIQHQVVVVLLNSCYILGISVLAVVEPQDT